MNIVYGRVRIACRTAILAGAFGTLFMAASTLAAATRQAAPPPGSCPGDHVVWVNTQSGVYHYRGERYFGATKSGRFECEKAALAEGDRPTRNGQ